MRVLATMLILLAAAYAGASAASPLDDYIAARDASLKQFKDSDIIGDDAARAAHEGAMGDLEVRLRKIVGPSALKGFPAEGKTNLDSLAEGYEGFGLLDGLVYASADDASRIVVTTRELLDKWLAAHATWWGDKTDMPPGLESALKSEAFYTQALSTDAYFYKFVDIPLAQPAAATFAFATLVGRAQDVGRQTPNEVVAVLLRGGHAYVVLTPAAAKAETSPQCEQTWKKAEERARQAQSDKSDKLTEEAYRAYRLCFAAQAPRSGYFAAITKQAQALIDMLPNN
jgi:hypothetical protein